MDSRTVLQALLRAGPRVGITGAAGAGKTTFARYLCEGAPDLLHDEGVRDWSVAHGIERFADIDSVQFCELHLHLLGRYERSCAHVFDRTPADLFFYASAGKSEFLNLDELESACRSLQAKIDLLVVFPFHLPHFAADFARENDKLEHIRASGLVLDILKRWELLGDTILYDHSSSQEANTEVIYQRLRDR